MIRTFQKSNFPKFEASSLFMSPYTFMSYKSRIVGTAMASLAMDLLTKKFLEHTNERTIGLPYFVMKISISCDFWHRISVLSHFEMFFLFGIGLCWVYFRGFGTIQNYQLTPIRRVSECQKSKKKLNPTLCYPVHFRPLLTIFWRFLSTLSINWIAIGVW